MGAVIIEKHFTLDRSLPGPDHQASLEPEELKEMVRSIRTVELALGDGVKCPTASELKNLPVARKSLVAKVEIKLGDVFTAKNLEIKRPGDGITPMKYWEMLGNISLKNYSADEVIK